MHGSSIPLSLLFVNHPALLGRTDVCRLGGSEKGLHHKAYGFSMDFLFVGLFMLLAPAGAAGPMQVTGAGEHAYIPVTTFDPARDAARDIRDAVAEARRSGRRVLLDVGGDWCIWCRRLDTLYAQHPDLRKFLDENFVVVKVNWSRENKNERVLSAYPRIPGYPHYFVLDAGGKLLHSQDTGLLESGNHHDPAKVLAFLKASAPRAGK